MKAARNFGAPVAAIASSPAFVGAFTELDERVRQPGASGVMLIAVPHVEDMRALASHLERRTRGLGRPLVRAYPNAVESAWRDAGRRLGLQSLPTEPAEAAQALAQRADAQGAAVIVPFLGVTAWDTAVLSALSEREGGFFMVLVLRELELRTDHATRFELAESLDDRGLYHWWAAIAENELRSSPRNLRDLEAQLTHPLVSRPPIDPDLLSLEARALLERLAVAGRAWPIDELTVLGERGELDSLMDAGVVELRDGFVAPVQVVDVATASPDSLLSVASALAAVFSHDPWALIRAAELEARADRAHCAEQRVRSALAQVLDAVSRAELWRLWQAGVESLVDPQRARMRLHGAELALECGDIEIALEWASRAAATDSVGRAALVLGRAALARGDLVAAEAALARAGAPASELSLEAQGVLAEAKYAGGELARAEALAREIVASKANARVRLEASNLLGKLLLARAEWHRAEQHFAADACEAALAGEAQAELRARVNRAIALLSRGNCDEARPMLYEVLGEAEARGELRGVAFALSNLAVLAMDRHDYSEALDCLERAISVRRRMGDRVGFAGDVTNLVELRLRLGLDEQAEQALRFGRHALGAGAPASRLSELALAAARVHFRRGRPLEAEREVRTAMRASAGATDGDKLGQCHRLAARIALEDGMVSRARAELARARELVFDDYARVEVAILEALIVRAAGQPALAMAVAAGERAREIGEEEFTFEAHLIAAEAALSDGDDEQAREHVRAARAVRDEVMARLPHDLADAYVSRAEFRKLTLLERSVRAGEVSDSVPPESVPVHVGLRAPRTSYLGRHPKVRSLLSSVERVGRTDATVLIFGESGTGKELIAEAIHAASERARGPLVKVNCAALVESLLLSELFGHEKGAFTGAAARRRGRFERANGGTLFLDEIGDISPRTQVALLRVLEEHTIERVGGTAPIAVDVRIVCATHRDLHALVARGEFREDLYYRLSGIMLEVPALRDRLADLPLLCTEILRRIARERNEPEKQLSSEALELLARHRWPGNVRELENALHASALFAPGQIIEASDLVEHIEVLRKVSALPSPTASLRAHSEGRVITLPARSSLNPPLEAVQQAEATTVTSTAYREIRDGRVSLGELKRQIERECIERALRETSGNITRAAAVLGMKRPRLSQLVKQYGLSSSGEEDGA